MLHIDHDTKYFWYQDVTDFRKGFAGLSGLVREHMRKEVTDGGVFIFCQSTSQCHQVAQVGSRRTGNLSQTIGTWPFETPVSSSDGRHMRVSSEQLSLILHGIRLSSVMHNKRFTLRSKGYPQKVNES